MTVKAKRWKSWLLGALFAAIPFVVIRSTFTTHYHNEANRNALATLHGSIAPEDTRGQVLADYYENRTDDLRLHCDEPAECIIGMPGELGATDWNLRIEFCQGRVFAVRMRSTNGPKPNAGPDDKVE